MQEHAGASIEQLYEGTHGVGHRHEAGLVASAVGENLLAIGARCVVGPRHRYPPSRFSGDTAYLVGRLPQRPRDVLQCVTRQGIMPEGTRRVTCLALHPLPYVLPRLPTAPHSR
jgi:hypothetical protein